MIGTSIRVITKKSINSPLVYNLYILLLPSAMSADISRFSRICDPERTFKLATFSGHFYGGESERTKGFSRRPERTFKLASTERTSPTAFRVYWYKI